VSALWESCVQDVFRVLRIWAYSHSRQVASSVHSGRIRPEHASEHPPAEDEAFFALISAAIRFTIRINQPQATRGKQKGLRDCRSPSYKEDSLVC
jgi:hypothetical protein